MYIVLEGAVSLYATVPTALEDDTAASFVDLSSVRKQLVAAQRQLDAVKRAGGMLLPSEATVTRRADVEDGRFQEVAPIVLPGGAGDEALKGSFLGVRKPGDSLGDHGLLLPQPSSVVSRPQRCVWAGDGLAFLCVCCVCPLGRYATAIASKATELLVVSRTDYLQLFEACSLSPCTSSHPPLWRD